EQKPLLEPCTVINPANNGFYDLSDLYSSVALASSSSNSNPNAVINPNSNSNNGALAPGPSTPGAVGWNAKGHDYGMNFTLGICSSPLKPNNEVVDITNTSLVGAYYTDFEGQKFSIGNFNTTPIFRGRKLTLTYQNGSYCPNTNNHLRKSSILNFICDKELLTKASISFVGVLNDCDYFFEVRTSHACVTSKKTDNLTAIWIFLSIVMAFLIVSCGGGFLYK
ncbi:Mrl1p, partial [Ascoidea rubescens DSM 1968]